MAGPGPSWLARLRQIPGVLAARQEKVLVFTQFEATAPPIRTSRPSGA